MAHRQSESGSRLKAETTQYRLKKSASNPWSVDWHLYKERHLMKCFSVSSNILEELPPAMTSWQKHF